MTEKKSVVSKRRATKAAKSFTTISTTNSSDNSLNFQADAPVVKGSRRRSTAKSTANVSSEKRFKTDDSTHAPVNPKNVREKNASVEADVPYFGSDTKNFVASQSSHTPAFVSFPQSKNAASSSPVTPPPPPSIAAEAASTTSEVFRKNAVKALFSAAVQAQKALKVADRTMASAVKASGFATRNEMTDLTRRVSKLARRARHLAITLEALKKKIES